MKFKLRGYQEKAVEAGEQAASGFFQTVFSFYETFIKQFPIEYQWVISAVLVIAIVGSLWNLIKKNWLWIVLVVAIFPGILPMFKNVFDSLSALFTGQ